MKVCLDVKVPTAVNRPAALHQRAERVDPDVGQLADRENAEPELGGGLQGAHHHPPPHVLWQRGINQINEWRLPGSFLQFCVSEVHAISRLKQQQLPAEWLSGQDRSSRFVNEDKI